MNILYFDERQLWSPEISDVLDDVEGTHSISVSKLRLQEGKLLTIEVALISAPDFKFEVVIGEE
jgi:hypothetical protein